jgi:UDP-N-acetyl-D-galactosamine dehydrogenase
MSKVAVVGVGYVGLNTAIKFAKSDMEVIAFDSNELRIAELSQGNDSNNEYFDFKELGILFTANPQDLMKANYFIVDIPTPVDKFKVPILDGIKKASHTVGKALKKGDLVIFESTVFPGATEEIMLPILESESKLKSGMDFYLAYSPERIVPGDKEHSNTSVSKIISGQNSQALSKTKELFKQAKLTSLVCAKNIKIAEASKLLENIQRDVNIALMNEYAQIMQAMGLCIHDVLEVAKTKWNFIPFSPGFVGGHCIPVDPYYLIYKANQVGTEPRLISCARKINEHLVDFIEQKITYLLNLQGFNPTKSKIGILGISFKANVADTRHSLSLHLIDRLSKLGSNVFIYDPVAKKRETNASWIEWEHLTECNAIILCKEHSQYCEKGLESLCDKLVPNGVFIDIPGYFKKHKDIGTKAIYWSL